MNEMTRRGAVQRLALISLSGAVIARTDVGAAERTVRIRLGTLAPKGSSAFKHLQSMGEQWRKISGESLSLTIYPDGTMGGEADMVRRMRIGQLQAGLLTAVGLSEIEPAVTGLQNLPLMFRSLEEVDYIGDKLQPLLEKRLEEKGFVVLFWVDAGWVYFFSKDPIRTIDELRQAKLFAWAGNRDQVDLYKSTGFNPVPLETVDILPNLQTGLITAVPMPPFVALASQVDGPAPNMLDLRWAPLVGAAVISKRTYDSISPSLQAPFKKAAAAAGLAIKEDNRRESADSIKAMQQRGLRVQSITPEVEADWRRQVEEAYPKIRGSMVPADIFDRVVELLKEYRAAR